MTRLFPSSRRSSAARARSLSILSLAVLVAAPATTALAQAPSRSALAARIDSLVNAALKPGRIAAVSVAVVKGRDTIVMKGYGLADLENDVPASAQTVFRIGSITKQFTSAAVMQLVEQGKIGLDDDITKYLPSFPTHGQKILVRHLLNHTSGIPSYTDVGPVFGKIITLDLPHDSLLATVANDSLLFPPGTSFYYNNTGYYMLGMVLEKVTGKKYGDYLAEQLFTPLGLRGTRYCDVSPLIKHRAQGYGLEKGALVNASYIDMGLPFAAGSLCSTVRDLVAWEAALYGGKVVSASSLAMMTTPVKLPGRIPMRYGFGLVPDTLGSHRVIGHGGGINGFISHVEYYPDDSLYIAVLSNTAPAPSQELARNAARIVLGLPPVGGPTPPKEVAIDSAQRARYVGDYAMQTPAANRVPSSVAQQGTQLLLQNSGRKARLIPLGDDIFAIEGQPGARVYFTMSGGRAAGFVLDQGLRPLSAVRKESP